MTPEQFKLFRVYTLYDGVYLAVLMSASFAGLIGMSAFPPLSMVSMLLGVGIPFFVGYRLWLYRRDAMGGCISFVHAFHYSLRMFLYAAMLFAIVQWAYMAFLDGGRLSAMVLKMMADPAYEPLLRTFGISIEQMKEASSSVSPVDFALSYLVENLFIGLGISILVALVMRKS